MSKAFTKESDGDDEDDLPDEIAGLPACLLYTSDAADE